MSSAEKDLKGMLLEAGNKLQLRPLPPVDELLRLLDQVENYLQRVEQSPPKSMQSALSSSIEALVADELLRHSDVDVKVAVASCISEITRITAPDAPYDDDKMKDVFQLIVSSFESLSDRSSRSYNRRASILETVAKVRSCVVMLDLECDGMIIEMFQHFLKAIRDYHSENVFSSMETIMTLVLEESEDISLELLTTMLDSVKKDNENISPVGRKLGKKVFESCALKLKPYLNQALKGVSLDNYSKIVASICEGTTTAEQNGGNVSGDHLVAKESATGEACSKEVDTAVDKSPRSVVSNGVTETAKEETLVDPESSEMPDDVKIANESANANVAGKSETDDMDAGKQIKLDNESEQPTNQSATKPSESSRVDSDGEAEKLTDKKNQNVDVEDSHAEHPSPEPATASEDEIVSYIQPSSPNKTESEAVNVTPPSPSGSIPGENRPKKVGRPKKESSSQERAQSADNVSDKPSRKSSNAVVKHRKRSGKKMATDEYRTPAIADVSKNEGGTSSDSEVKPLKQSGKKVDASNKVAEKSSSKKDDRKRQGRGKDSSEKEATKSSAKESASSPKSTTKSSKDEVHSDETPKVDSKRKRTPGNEKVSGTDEFGANLIGSKVRVWWPKDRAYYKGIIEHFDPVKKKHKVLYTDGDEETLNLKKEKWHFVERDSDSDEEPAKDQSPDTSEMHKKKKVKTNPEPSAKEQKTEVSPKRGGTASSSKSKGTTMKSGRKSKDGGKVDSNLKDSTSKLGGLSEDDAGSKSKEPSLKGGRKSTEDTPRAAGKSKGVDSGKPKIPAKSKQDTPNTAIKSKGKTSQTGNDSSANGTGKVKSTLSKMKETRDVKEKSPDSAKKPEGGKVKSPDSLKVQESEARSGRKRRRAKG